MSEQLTDILENIESRANLSDFIRAFLKDLEHNTAEWENASLHDFLEAMLA